jgi:Pectate lyase superfamily protein
VLQCASVSSTPEVGAVDRTFRYFAGAALLATGCSAGASSASSDGGWKARGLDATGHADAHEGHDGAAHVGDSSSGFDARHRDDGAATPEAAAPPDGHSGSEAGHFDAGLGCPETANGGLVNVKAYGAVGDGMHDDTAPLLAALAAAASGATVCVPSGRYLVSSPLVISNRITLTGAGDGVGDAGEPNDAALITTLLMNPATVYADAGFGCTEMIVEQTAGVVVANLVVDGQKRLSACPSGGYTEACDANRECPNHGSSPGAPPGYFSGGGILPDDNAVIDHVVLRDLNSFGILCNKRTGVTVRYSASDLGGHNDQLGGDSCIDQTIDHHQWLATCRGNLFDSVRGSVTIENSRSDTVDASANANIILEGMRDASVVNNTLYGNIIVLGTENYGPAAASTRIDNSASLKISGNMINKGYVLIRFYRPGEVDAIYPDGGDPRQVADGGFGGKVSVTNNTIAEAYTYALVWAGESGANSTGEGLVSGNTFTSPNENDLSSFVINATGTLDPAAIEIANGYETTVSDNIVTGDPTHLLAAIEVGIRTPVPTSSATPYAVGVKVTGNTIQGSYHGEAGVLVIESDASVSGNH